MSEERGYRTAEAFFGRRHGKTIRPRQADALAKGLPALRLDLLAPAPDRLSTLFDTPVEKIVVEIGFGGGEHLHSASGLAPDTGFIGVEPFVNGMATLLRSLERDARPNVRLYDDDAVRVLDWLPAGSIDRVDLFYPDPWPKKRHWKRRFVNQPNLTRIARALKPGAHFRFASDIGHYINWTLVETQRQGSFDWQAETASNWHRPYDGWPGTRYEAKAIREGRPPAYLTFVRR